MKRKNTRALLSLALALLMTLSLLPTAFAEEAPPSPTLSSPSPSPAASPLPSPVASPGAERSPDPSPGPEKTYVAKIVRDGTDVSFETIDAAIAALGVTNMSGMGKVIQSVMGDYKGRVDGKAVSAAVKARLS